MADFDLSGVIKVDASGAVAGSAQFDKALDQVAASEKRASTGASELAATTRAASAAQAEAARAATVGAAAQRSLGAAVNATTASMRGQAGAARGLGVQFNDFFTQVSLGQSATVAFASNIGQVGFAMSNMSGAAGVAGRFLAGMGGGLVAVAAIMAGPFIESMIRGTDAAEANKETLEAAAGAADSFGNAQSMLGKVIDLTTGKLKTQNVVLIQTIRLLAQVNLLDAQKRLRELTGGDKVTITPGGPGTAFMGAGQGFNPASAGAAAAQRSAQAKQLETILASLGGVVSNSALAQRDPETYSKQLGAAIDVAIKKVDRLAVGGKVAGDSLESVKKKILDIGTAGNDQAAAFESLSVLAGGPIPDSLKPYARDKKGRTRKPKSTDAVDEFGRDAADKIADVVAQFSEMPTAVARADKAVRDLDDLIEDLGRRKPPNFAELIKSAEAAKGVITDSLNRPYEEFIEHQEDALRIQGLIGQGRIAEADALRTIVSLESQGVPLTQARKDAILASVQALREEGRQIDINREKNQKFVYALGGIKGAIDDATQAFVRGDLGQFIKTPRKLLDAFITLQGQKLFERLFGDLFRDLEAQVDGTKVVKDAADRFAKATEVARSAVDDLGRAATSAADKLNGVRPRDTLSETILDENGEPINPGIVVSGNKMQDPTSLFAKTLGGVAEKILGTFTSDAFAKSVGGSIGKYAGIALEGAATGTAINGVMKSLGIKTSNTGAQIGGAVGSIATQVTGIPGLDVIGSIAGGLIGGAFKKPSFGTATLSNVNDPARLAGRAGAEAGANTLAGAVQSGVQQIADQLGGILGNFAVSIGTFDGKYRVSTTGFSGQLDSKTARGQGLVDFGKDGEAAAIAYAIMDAIADGAVQGLTPAVQAALKSSTDINKALNEALKTRELELAIGGLGAQLKRVFTDFDKQAADRVRIAKAYGLDLIAVEKLNAEQRVKLVDDTLKSRIGSLQEFVNALRFGDLFEGSAADRRQAILGEITKVKADAEAGIDGAADKLADLYRQLTLTSRDAFGTAGPEFTGDRAAALTGVERVIEMERARVNEAAGLQQATTQAIQQNNTLTSQTNALISQGNEIMASVAAALASFGFRGGLDLGLTDRYVELR